MSTPERFVCAGCHEVYEKQWSEEEAHAEFERTFPEQAAAGNATENLCHTCYQGFIEWARSEGIVP